MWCFYQLFAISFWRHPFTTEDPLARVSQNLFWWRNKFIYILDGLGVNIFTVNISFWVNCSFKCVCEVHETVVFLICYLFQKGAHHSQVPPLWLLQRQKHQLYLTTEKYYRIIQLKPYNYTKTRTMRRWNSHIQVHNRHWKKSIKYLVKPRAFVTTGDSRISVSGRLSL